jgi:hypothetical protein
MAKKGQSLVDYSKRSQDDPPKVTDFRDPTTGRRLNSIGEPRAEKFAKATPVGTGLKKPSDSKA